MVRLFDRLKRKPSAAEDSARQMEAVLRPTAGKGERRIIGVLERPHITEKTSRAGAGGWYAFHVKRGANKMLIRRAVEDRYGVSVTHVRIIHQPPRQVRLGRIMGRVPGFVKAMVKVKAGEHIELT